MDAFAKLASKGLHETLISIMRKYCNGEYGFESRESVSGEFQLGLLQAFIKLASDQRLLEEFLTGGLFSLLTQMVEEAIVFGFKSGVNHHLETFLEMSLAFFSLTLTRHHMRHVAEAKE